MESAPPSAAAGLTLREEWEMVAEGGARRNSIRPGWSRKLDRLERLLAADDLNSADALRHLSAAIAGRFGRPALAELRGAAATYDFHATLEALRRLRSRSDPRRRT
jgi:hypothetical protein